MRSLSRYYFHDALAFLQLLILLELCVASPLTLNGASRLSRDTREASQNAKSIKLGYADLPVNRTHTNSTSDYEPIHLGF